MNSSTCGQTNQWGCRWTARDSLSNSRSATESFVGGGDSLLTGQTAPRTVAPPPDPVPTGAASPREFHGFAGNRLPRLHSENSAFV